MKIPIFLIVFGFFELALGGDKVDDKVHLTVYYESLCPDSIKFFTKQLYPVYTGFDAFLNLTLVPYGKSTQERLSNGSWSFTCHHGPNECYGNKVQACVLHYIQPTSDRLKLLNCLMDRGQKVQPYPLDECGKSTAIHVDHVASCANMTEGDELLAALGEITNKFRSPLESVPTIVLNDIFNKNTQELAVNNLKNLICSNIKTGKPAQCSSPNSTAAMKLSVLALLLTVFIRAI